MILILMLGIEVFKVTQSESNTAAAENLKTNYKFVKLQSTLKMRM